MVREFLIRWSGEETEFERLKRLQNETLDTSTHFTPETGCRERTSTAVAAFVDTNVLLYAASTAGDEAAKRLTARAILEREDLVLSVQVLQEFYVQAIRRDSPIVSRTIPP